MLQHSWVIQWTKLICYENVLSVNFANFAYLKKAELIKQSPRSFSREIQSSSTSFDHLWCSDARPSISREAASSRFSMRSAFLFKSCCSAVLASNWVRKTPNCLDRSCIWNKSHWFTVNFMVLNTVVKYLRVPVYQYFSSENLPLVEFFPAHFLHF